MTDPQIAQITKRELRESELRMTGRPPAGATGFIGFVPAVPSTPSAPAAPSPTSPGDGSRGAA